MASIAPRRFAPAHPLDRYAFPALLGLIWLGIVMGFTPGMARHLTDPTYHYPLIVHAHAAAFVGWLLLLTTQVALVRTGRVGVHRQLGQVGAFLALAMLVLGPLTAITVDRLKLDTPKADPAFLSIQLLSMIAFGILVAWALAKRRDPAAHRRLMLLATLAMTGAGYGRWWGQAFYEWLGAGFWSELWGDNLGVLLLVAAMGVHDLVTRGRLHPAYVGGATVVTAAAVGSAWLYVAPWWAPVAEAIIRM